MSQLGLDMSPEQATRRRRLGSVVAVLLALLVVAVLLGALLLVGLKLFKSGGADDYVGSGTGQVDIRVAPNAGASQIAATLAANGVIKSASAFLAVNQGDDRLTKIQPGTYRMHVHMSSSAALDLFFDPTARLTNKVVIPEGATVKKTLQLLASKGGLDPTDLKTALAHVGALGLPHYAHGKVEGFLFPATYDVDSSTSAAQQLKAMVTRWNQAASDASLISKSKAVKLQPYQVLVVASLVQAEVGPKDFSKVARVIYNRMAKGMPLQLDTTVLYALGRTGTSLSLQDLKVASPFNTYVHKGLPPTPIDNPGEAAITAALQPAKGNWLYYVTVNLKTGETKFTKSYSEFLKFTAELKANS
jgi:UPF0755 protein